MHILRTYCESDAVLGTGEKQVALGFRMLTLFLGKEAIHNKYPGEKQSQESQQGCGHMGLHRTEPNDLLKSEFPSNKGVQEENRQPLKKQFTCYLSICCIKLIKAQLHSYYLSWE